MSFQRLSSLIGVLGCLVLLVAVMIAAYGYVGMDCEPYSMANHFISELGDRRVSPLSEVFNIGLMVSAAALMVFGIGFATIFKGWQRKVMGILGLSTSISCFLVGALPMDLLHPHILAAIVFFHSALVMVFVNTGITLLTKQPILPKWTVVPGFVTAGIFAAFVVSPSDLIREWIRDPAHFVRPTSWGQCMLEWACFFSIVAWIIIVAALVFLRQTRQSAQS